MANRMENNLKFLGSIITAVEGGSYKPLAGITEAQTKKLLELAGQLVVLKKAAILRETGIALDLAKETLQRKADVEQARARVDQFVRDLIAKYNKARPETQS